MPLVVKDRVKETTTTAGTGTITLAGAVSGFQSFSVIGDGNTTYYAIVGGTQWEVGIGTYTASGTTLSRDTVLESSTGGTKVDFAAGTKDVFCTYPAERSVDIDAAQTLTNKTFDGGTIVTANSSADALRITQTGAGNALVVEDSANPDSTPFVVNASGQVGIGTTSPAANLEAYGTIQARPAATQDAVAIAGRAGGTSSYVLTLTPATLSASRTLTLPDPGSNETLGYLNIPQNSQSADYTLQLTDSGKHIFHPSADTTARTFTIPPNSGAGSVAFPIGTAVTFINQNGAGVVTIAITTDTMRLAGAGTTGSRTLAANGVATAIKITSTEWIISGTGLT